MHFAVLGTGDVGRTLAVGLHGKGHDITVGTRDPAKLQSWAAEHAGIPVATFADAAAASEAAILAVGWDAVAPVLAAAGPHLANKLLIDATNPLKTQGDGPPGLDPSGDDSAGETVQRLVPLARVVKCWNIVGHPHMIDPSFDGTPAMFIGGNDRQAKEDVRALLAQCGWSDMVDLGGIDTSRYLEGLAMVWIRTYFATGSGDMSLALVRR